MINTRSLAESLRAATEALHRQAERSGYIQEILRKRSSRQGYGVLLRNLEPLWRDNLNGRPATIRMKNWGRG